MQSWGVQSRFSVRDTGLEPSQSGVVGLLCAALGRRRQQSVEDLAGLRMGVRVDQEGVLARDFQTAMNVLKAGGGIKDTEPSARYYLADARFLVGLAGDDLDLLRRLHAALRDPRWPLYLGRKAFVPGEPIWLSDGLCSNGTLQEVLESYPWLGCDPRRRPDQVRLVLEDPGGADVRPDQPLSFAERRFGPRRVTTTFVPAPPQRKEDAPCTSRD
jgi:CRISPR system Cascade subunit CasD